MPPLRLKLDFEYIRCGNIVLIQWGMVIIGDAKIYFGTQCLFELLLFHSSFADSTFAHSIIPSPAFLSLPWKDSQVLPAIQLSWPAPSPPYHIHPARLRPCSCSPSPAAAPRHSATRPTYPTPQLPGERQVLRSWIGNSNFTSMLMSNLGQWGPTRSIKDANGCTTRLNHSKHKFRHLNAGEENQVYCYSFEIFSTLCREWWEGHIVWSHCWHIERIAPASFLRRRQCRAWPLLHIWQQCTGESEHNWVGLMEEQNMNSNLSMIFVHQDSLFDPSLRVQN